MDEKCNNNEKTVHIRHLRKEIYTHKRIRQLRKQRARNDWSSYWYLLKKLKLQELKNFRFTKSRVPTGEGFYRGRDRKQIKRPDKVGLPPYFEVETTTICNKKCTICEYVYWKKGDQVRRHMTLDEFKHIIDQFPTIKWVNLTGEGSSFLNKDYPSMLKYLWNKHKTSIWLVDHLSDISMEQLEKDVLPYIHGIYVSMDASTKETYENIKIGCNFENAVNNLKKLIEYKRKNSTPFPHLSFRYIILKENLSEIPSFVDLINSIALQSEWGGSSTKIEFTGLLYFKEIMDKYVGEVPQSIIEELKTKVDGIEIQFSHAEEVSNPPIARCSAWLEPYIMMPGYVLPCCAVMMSNRRPFLREYSFGNVFEDNITDIWNNDYYKRFRNIVNDPTKPVPKICAGCRAYQTKERIRQNGIWDIHKD